MNLNRFLLSSFIVTLSFVVLGHEGTSLAQNMPQVIQNYVPSKAQQDRLNSLLKARYEAEQKAVEREGELKQITEATSLKDQYASIDQLLLQRHAQALILTDQIDSSMHRVAFSAAFLAGQLKLEETLPALIRRIDVKNLHVQSVDRDRQPLWGVYPMSEAVQQFGNKATPALLSHLASTDDDPMKHKIVVDTLVNIEGSSIAPLIINGAINQETDPVRRNRLTVVVQELQKPVNTP